MSNFKTRYRAVVANLRRNRRFVFTELTEIICQQPAMIGSNALFKNISFEKRKNFNIFRMKYEDIHSYILLSLRNQKRGKRLLSKARSCISSKSLFDRLEI